MTRILTGVIALAALLMSGAAAQAGEAILPFHATLQLTEDCESSLNPSEQCQHFSEWLAACQAQGYDWAFQDVRTGRATPLGAVTSFEQGCLDFPENGPPGLVHSYVWLTVTWHASTITSFNQVVFNFAEAAPPATGTFVITGGTGRFAGARGSGTLGNVFDNGNPGWIIFQDGYLRLSGGDR